MFVGFHVNYHLFLSKLSETCVFLDIFSKNTDISNFLKILTVGDLMFRADGRTDMTGPSL